MSTTIDERVVEMVFDNASFENGVKDTMSSVSSLNKSLESVGANNGFSNIEKAASGVDFSTLTTALGTVQSSLSSLEVIGITALSNITTAVMDTVSSIATMFAIDPITTGFQEYETQIDAIQTILSNTTKEGTTLTTVNAALDELNTYADKTIYNFTEMTKNIGTFTAAGVNLDTSVAAIKGIANLAAVSGSSSTQAATAMYQLSQAMASGYVNLQDWNSVVNAGMGGTLFQDSLTETAAQFGIDVQSMIDDAGSFRLTLSEGWLTTDILTETLAKFTGDMSEIELEALGYTEEQITEIIALGEMANDAATKVKTFTQLIDTLKEAAQSGWSQSWRTIIGDFDEAKELFTEISDTLGGLIGASSDARNALLTSGLSSGWEQFISNGIADEQAYIDAITEIAEEQGIAVTDMIEDMGSFKSTLSEGWLTAELMTDGLANLTAETYGLSDAELDALGYTRDQIDALEELNEKIQNGTLSLDEYVDAMTASSGRDNLIDALRNSFNALLAVSYTVTDAFSNIFPAMTGDQLFSLTENIKNFTASLIISEDTAELLERTFSGLFAILSIGKNLVLAIATNLFSLSDVGGGLATTILTITASIGDWLVHLSNLVEESDVFNNVLSSMVAYIRSTMGTVSSKFSEIWASMVPIFESLSEGIDSFVVTAKTQFSAFKAYLNDTFGGFDFQPVLDFFSSIVAGVIQIKENSRAMADEFASSINYMSDSLDGSPLLSFFSAIGTALTMIIGGAATGITALVTGIMDGLSSLNLAKFIEIIDATSLVMIGTYIIGFLDDLADPLDRIVGLMDTSILTVSSFKGSMIGLSEAFKTNLNSDTIYNIGKAMLVLAAALFIISIIDSDKLVGASVAIVALFNALTTSLQIFTKLAGNIATMVAVSTSLILIASAVSILATSMLMLGMLNTDQIHNSLIAIWGLLAGLILFVNYIDANQAKMLKGLSSLVTLSVAVLILSVAISNLSKLDPIGMVAGTAAVVALMAALYGFVNNIGDSSVALKISIALVALSVAILILAYSVERLSSIYWTDLIAGLIAVAVLIASLALSMKMLPTNLASIGTSLIAFSIGVFILSEAVIRLGTMDYEQLDNGLTALRIALLSIVLAINALPNNVVSLGAGLLIVSAALLVLAGALYLMGSINDAGQSLMVMAVSLIVLAGVLTVMEGTIAGAAAMVIAAAAMLILAPALILLGSIGFGTVCAGLFTLAATLVAIAIAATVLAPLLPTMAALAVVMALIGVAAAGIGIGALALSTALGAFSASIVLYVTAIVASISIVIQAVLDLIVNIVLTIINAFTAFIDALRPLLASIAMLIFETGVLIIATAILLLAEIPPLAVALIDALYTIIIEAAPKFLTLLAELMLMVGETFLIYIPELCDKAALVVVAFMNSVADSITDNKETILDAFFNILFAIFEVIGYTFCEVEAVIFGSNIISGFILGVLDGASSLVSAIVNVVTSAIDAAKDILGIASPSKVFFGFGEYTDQGFINGLTSLASKVKSAGASVGEEAIDGMSSVLSGVSDALTSDLDTTPVIRPVLDLTDISEGASQISSMFGATQAATISSGFSAGEYNDNADISGEDSTSGSVTFNQYNTSPKSLSRTEIYRQTKNQLSEVKRRI